MSKLLAVAAAAVAMAACPREEPPRPAAPPPPVANTPVDYTAESYVPPPLPTGKVLLKDAYGGAHAVEVEIAATDHSRMRGLMWRKELAAGKGMLFLFPREAQQSFWMRNTLIPLDMIFIGKDMKIAGIVESTTPRSLESRGVAKLSQYVLEVPGGWSQKVGIRAGTAVEFVGTQGLIPEF